MSRTLNILVALVTLVAFGIGQVKEKSAPRVTEPMLKSAGAPRYALLNINNITTWHRHDGHSNHSPSADNGAYFPRGTANVIYQDGLVWGGKAFARPTLDGEAIYTQRVRVGGGTYSIGTRAGAVMGFGETAVPIDPNHADVRIYRIRRDWYDISDEQLRRDAAGVYEIPESEVTSEQILAVRSQYERDWHAWPVSKGAPFIDRNKNGTYEPPAHFNADPSVGTVFTIDSITVQGWDEPGIAGAEKSPPADQVIWTVYNDLNETDSRSFAGSYPLGLEIQKTVWAYSTELRLSDVYFVRYTFINKGGVDTSNLAGEQRGSFWIDSMYVHQWSDLDLGNFSNDASGTDTVLDMTYSYNHAENDAEFARFGLPPPAIGYCLLAGPIIPDTTAEAWYGLSLRRGFRNLRLSVSHVYSPGDPYAEPPGGSSSYHTGSGRWWKILRGFAPIGDFSTQDMFYPHPPFASPTFLLVTGDPTTGTGWLQGTGTYWPWSAGDARFNMGAGPFQMAPGDTQVIVFAVSGGMGADHLSSVGVLRYNIRNARSIFRHQFATAKAKMFGIPKAISFDGTIVLSWGEDRTETSQTESSIAEYEFEGYNVYQLPEAHAELRTGHRLVTFDRRNGVRSISEPVYDASSGLILSRVVQHGKDRGIQRYMIVKTDSSGLPMFNGNDYHFAITSYHYSPDPHSIPSTIESEPVYVSATPSRPMDTRLLHQAGDTLKATHIAGSGMKLVVPMIIDATAGTGDTYEVRFDSTTAGWSMSAVNLTRGTTLVENRLDPSHPDNYEVLEGGVVLIVEEGTGASNGLGDIYRYTVAAPVRGVSVERENVARLTVFPNPVYRHDTRVATFLNVPRKATVRIFNLGGHLVRRIEKDDGLTFVRWDLLNEDGWLVAGGMYVCHIDMPTIGESKVLKLAVIQDRLWE